MTAEKPTPAPRRRLGWIVASLAIVFGIVGWIALNESSEEHPTEIWVPAAAVGPAGDRRLLDDVRVAPGGRELRGWRTEWAESRDHQPCLFVRKPIPWWEGMPFTYRTDCFKFRTGGFIDSGERRDIDGKAWSRLAWIDAEPTAKRIVGD